MLPLTQVLLALAFFVLGADAIDGDDSALLISGLIILILGAGNEIVRMIVAANPDDPEDTPATAAPYPDDDAG